MGFTLSYTDRFGATHATAYVKIDQTKDTYGDGGSTQSNIHAKIWHDKAARDADKPHLIDVGVNLVDDGEQSRPDQYADMKQAFEDQGIVADKAADLTDIDPD